MAEYFNNGVDLSDINTIAHSNNEQHLTATELTQLQALLLWFATNQAPIDAMLAWFATNQTALDAIILQSQKAAPLGLNFVVSTISSITIDWLSDGSPEYKIYYKKSSDSTWLDAFSYTNSATVNNLDGGTEYEFQIQSIEFGVNSARSASLYAFTLPSLDIFQYPTLINVGGALSANNIIALEDNTEIYVNDLTASGTPLVTLNKGDVYNLGTSNQFDTITFPTGNCYCCGRHGASNNGSSVTWQPAFLANNTGFAFSTYRNNPQRVAVWAVEDATLTLTDGTNTVQTLNLTANSGGLFQWDMPSNVGLRYYDISTTGYVLCYLYSNGYIDPWVLMPLSKQIIVTPSNLGRVYTTDTMVDVDAQRSNGTTTTLLLNIGTSANIGTTGSQMSGDCWTYTVSPSSPSARISGNQLADSNGGCSTPAIPTSLFYSKAGTTERADYVKFMSTVAAVINIFNPDGTPWSTPQITLQGTGISYEERITNPLTAIYFEVDASSPGKFCAVWQPRSTDDETAIMVYEI